MQEGMVVAYASRQLRDCEKSYPHSRYGVSSHGVCLEDLATLLVLRAV